MFGISIQQAAPTPSTASRGLAGWLMTRVMTRLRGGLRPATRRQPRLELIERIVLAPRQSLALVEAEGRRFLVACSAESTPAFYPVDGRRQQPGSRRVARISW